MDEGADVEAKSAAGDTPLFSAAAGLDYADIANLLLSEGADVNARNKDGATPLDLALKAGKTSTQQVLLHFGAERSK